MKATKCRYLTGSKWPIIRFTLENVSAHVYSRTIIILSTGSTVKFEFQKLKRTQTLETSIQTSRQSAGMLILVLVLKDIFQVLVLVLVLGGQVLVLGDQVLVLVLVGQVLVLILVLVV